MNATLTYAVELEDIPNELRYQLDYIRRELASASNEAQSVISGLNGNIEDKNVLTLLHDIRIHMAKIDTRMEDCMSILSGYVNYLENPPQLEEDAEDAEGGEEEKGEENEEG